MNNQNYVEALKIPIYFLVLSGHWPTETSSFKNSMRCFLSWLIEIMFEVLLFMELFRHLDNLTALTAHMSILTPPTSFLIKLIIFSLNRQKLKAIMKDLDSVTSYPEHLEIHKTRAIKYSKFLGTMYQWICASVVSIYSSMPFIYGFLPIKFSYAQGIWNYPVYVIQVLGNKYDR